MTPISKRIRIITRSGYSAQIFRGKKNAAASAIDQKLGGQPHLFSERVEDNAFHLGGSVSPEDDGERKDATYLRAKENSAERLARPG
jgi:hypothetical protein